MLRREGRREETNVPGCSIAFPTPTTGAASVEPVHAVRDVSVRIARGSLTGLLGPNGCGKTTLLKLLAGVLAPEHGTVSLDGRALTTMSRRHVARRIAVVPQETHPAFEYTVLEMVLMGRHPHLGALQARRARRSRHRATNRCDATGTAHLAERSYMALSGGEKQRVVIASALAQTARSAAARRADRLARSRISARDRVAAAAR